MKLSRQNKQQGDRSGFTLIEVVLVLAIGGLIFLLAFLAFGQATKNRRDTQRRSDAGRVVSELQNAAGDANGKALGSSPDQTALNKFINNYLGGTGASGDSVAKFSNNNIAYQATYTTDDPTGDMTAGTGFMSVYQGAKCDGNSMTTTGGSGNVAVVVRLEKGQSCKDDQ